MPDRPKLSPVEYVAQFSPGASHAFEELRAAVLADGPLDNHTCELIVLGAFVTVGNEASFKVHARRLLRDQVPLAALRQAVLVTFAAATTFSQVTDGLRWIDQLADEAAARPA
jgi:alkylhydroperoxidase/carboxymuconolactone decarboxylase family protein YurZ